MPKLIILIALIIVLYLGWHQLKNLTPTERKRALLQIGFWSIVAVVLISVVTGRLHWVGAIIAAAAGVAKAILPKLIRYLPMLWPLFKQGSQHTKTEVNKKTTQIDEAYAILDLQAGASRTDVIEAHRKKMQKAHPDKGGSHDIAAQLNEAKQILLDHLNEQ